MTAFVRAAACRTRAASVASAGGSRGTGDGERENNGGEAAGQTRPRRLEYIVDFEIKKQKTLTSVSPELIITSVRRALLRAEPELPRSRLRGARAAQGTVREKITEAKRLGRRDRGAWNTLWILK
ncbi:hypothetical protein NDU88_002859 [Pleurodeles waltl]|uniref:Uncharacterized protein n=1 Tax=Pleurodeles waltl TaxID=8319 RepID=A0AAV7QB27_PLEWA|nr:hypothetical protein NDU88_002859 [Pleurodeles waltl]